MSIQCDENAPPIALEIKTMLFPASVAGQTMADYLHMQVSQEVGLWPEVCPSQRRADQVDHISTLSESLQVDGISSRYLVR